MMNAFSARESDVVLYRQHWGSASAFLTHLELLQMQGTSQGEPTGIADTQEPMSDKLAKLPDPGRPSLPDTEESLLVSTPSA
jgi:hypothetical protein